MASLNSLFEILTTSTSNIGTTVALKVGDGINPKNGKPVTLYARFKLPCVVQSAADVINVLRTMGAVTVPVSVPKINDGVLSISLRPVYRAEALCDVLDKYLTGSTLAEREELARKAQEEKGRAAREELARQEAERVAAEANTVQYTPDEQRVVDEMIVQVAANGPEDTDGAPKPRRSRKS